MLVDVVSQGLENFLSGLLADLNLGFDLNTLNGDVTLVTSYWSQQAIKVLNADGTLYVPGS